MLNFVWSHFNPHYAFNVFLYQSLSLNTLLRSRKGRNPWSALVAGCLEVFSINSFSLCLSITFIFSPDSNAKPYFETAFHISWLIFIFPSGSQFSIIVPSLPIRSWKGFNAFEFLFLCLSSHHIATISKMHVISVWTKTRIFRQGQGRSKF